MRRNAPNCFKITGIPTGVFRQCFQSPPLTVFYLYTVMDTKNLTPKQKSDLETLYEVSDKINELYGIINRIAETHSFPKTNKAGFFSDCTDLSNNVFLLANWIISPSAQTFLPEIQRRHNHAFNALVTHLNKD